MISISRRDTAVAVLVLCVSAVSSSGHAETIQWSAGMNGTVNANAELNVTANNATFCAGPTTKFTVGEVKNGEASIAVTSPTACKDDSHPVEKNKAYTAKVDDLNKISRKDADKPDGNTANEFFKDWGVGLAIIRGSKAAINDATIVNNTVRVNSQSNNDATLLVARHFYPFRNRDCSTGTGRTTGQYLGDCLGAMVGVGLGGTSSGSNGSQVISFVGVGLTIGGGLDTDKSTQWNFGYGFGRKFGVKVLGDGFTKDAPPPPGETQIRTKTVDMNAQFFFFTVHW